LDEGTIGQGVPKEDAGSPYPDTGLVPGAGVEPEGLVDWDEATIPIDPDMLALSCGGLASDDYPDALLTKRDPSFPSEQRD
jgi:hypothetical protein